MARRRPDPHSWQSVDVDIEVRDHATNTQVLKRINRYMIGWWCPQCDSFTAIRPELIWELPPCKATVTAERSGEQDATS